MASTAFTDGVTLTAASWFNDADTATYAHLTAPAGTNTITATGPASQTSYATGQCFRFTPAGSNTGATTLNISNLGAKNVFWNGVACVGGELRANIPAMVEYDGTQFHIVGNGFNVPATSAVKQATTSGTAINFTSIPAWVKQIVIQLVGVSTNGASAMLVQIGGAGGIETSGYLGASFLGAAGSGSVAANYTTGFGINSVSAADVLHGSLTLTLVDVTAFTWVCSGSIGESNAAAVISSGGSKSISTVLDRVRLTTVNGTDAFDAGSVNIVYT